MNTNNRSTRRKFLQATGASLVASQMNGALAMAAMPNREGIGSVRAWTSDSRFLSRAFAPVFDERDDADLIVEGQLPPGLKGAFLRNGPNPMFAPDSLYAYPFDGTGMVHGVYIDNGRARYRNRWVLTKEVREEAAAGRRLYNSSFGPPPNANLANTNIVHHAGRYLALFEGGVPYEMDQGLGTRGLFDFDGRLPGFMSAHPKVDPATGEMLAVAYDAKAGWLTYLRVDRTGHLDKVVPIKSPWPTMVHDIAVTERYVIAFVCPAVFDRTRKGPPITWQPERGTMIAVIPRDVSSADQVKWIKSAPFFQFHHVNAFEEGTRIEAVVPWYDEFSLTAPASRLELHRLVIHPDTGNVEDQVIDDRVCEFGRVNEAYLGRRARYGYVGFRDPRPGELPQTGAFESFARYDLVKGTKVVHRFAAGVTVCEPVFVADPQGHAEEDGFILTFAHKAGTQEGLFHVLDARQLAAEPVATIRLPRRVPAGLHGSWIAA